MPALAPLMALGTLPWLLTSGPAVLLLAVGIVRVRGEK